MGHNLKTDHAAEYIEQLENEINNYMSKTLSQKLMDIRTESLNIIRGGLHQSIAIALASLPTHELAMIADSILNSEKK